MKLRRWLAGITAAVVLGSVGSVALSSPASADELLGPFQIYNTYSGLCVENDDNVDGSYPLMNYCSSSTDQHYYLEPTSTNWVFTIQPSHVVYCLEPVSSQFNALIRQTWCGDPLPVNQRWLVVFIDETLRKFQNVSSGYCLRSYDLYVASYVVHGYCNDHNAIFQLIPE